MAAALGPLPYDPVTDFKPISMLGVSPYVLVACPCLTVKTVDELVRDAKAKPGKLSYGSAGPASMAYLAAALFASKAAIDLTHVPYRSSSQSTVDLMTGRIDIQFATIGPTLENIRAGKLRALAITTSRRSPVLPDVPTMIESGFPNYEIALWLALVAPAATPDSIIDRLNKELAAAIADPETRQALMLQGFEPARFRSRDRDRAHESRNRQLEGARGQRRNPVAIALRSLVWAAACRVTVFILAVRSPTRSQRGYTR